MNTRIQVQAGESSFRPLAIFFGLGLLSFNILAAPPNPPSLFMVGDNTSRIEEILGNYTRPSNLAALQYPADPVTTTTHEVRNNSELSAAIGSGRLIRIYGPTNGGQATYNQFNLSNRSDIDIVMDNDATIVGGSGWRWDAPVRRLRWTGGNVQFTSGGDGLTITDIEDVLFDDVRMWKNSGVNGHILLFQSGIRFAQRVAIINSTVEHLGTGFDYGIYIASQNVASGNWVIANNRVRGQATPARWMYLGQYAAIIANYFHGFSGGQPWRLHYQSSDIWIEDNVMDDLVGGTNQPLFRFDPSGEGGDTSATMENYRVYRNRLWATAGNINAQTVYRLGGTVEANFNQLPGWIIDGNIWHDPTGPSSASENNFGGITITNPYTRTGDFRVGPEHPDYEASPPPASNYGANR